MRIRAPFAAHALAVYAAALIFVAESSTTVFAQQPPPPWTGVAISEARPGSPSGVGGSGDVYTHAISGDARFLVFRSFGPLIAADTNGTWDIYVRDRVGGSLTRASVATTGTEADGMSFNASISRDGRHVLFNSCASNLDPADTNGQCDVFVHDRVSGKTSLASIGPNGQQGTSGYSVSQSSALSMDGRFVVFAAKFPSVPAAVYLRDRDPDVNGVFDEAGLATTVKIGDINIFGQLVIDIFLAINADASQIAYTSLATDEYQQDIGTRLFLFDRTNGTTVRVDQPLPTSGEVWAYTQGPDFSDSGELVFASDAPNLVDGDNDSLPDIFVYNIATAQRTRLALTHANAPALTYVFGPSISANGRYVAFTGQDGEPGFEASNVYAIDRDTSESYEISVRWDGTRDGGAGYGVISADGSAIALNASWNFVANPDGIGPFVATAVSMSPPEFTVPTQTTNWVSVEVSVPANTRWYGRLVRFDPDQYSMVLGDIYEGIGPTTVDVQIPGPMGYEEEDWFFAVGTKTVLIHRRMIPRIQNVDPFYLAPAGGTVVTINGDGFAQGATVLVGGVPATDVVVDEFGYWITATAPAGEQTFDYVPVTVLNPNGHSGTEEYGAMYYLIDDTPPVLESHLSGTQGQNGWWRSNVFVGWTLNDPESGMYDVSCPNLEVTADTASTIATCTASSDGGTSSIQVEIKRDATAPSASIVNPEARVYAVGQEVQIDVACADALSGMASCATSQGEHGGMLDTTTPGTFTFSVTATDNAGNPTTTSVNYTIKAVAVMSVAPATATYGGVPQAFTATLTAGGSGLAGKTVTFFLDHQVIDVVTTSASGVATTMLIDIDGRNAGTYALQANFNEDETALAAWDENALVIGKATPVLGWSNPAGIAYGTALSATQLNASASVAGSFAYTPAAGTVLPAGTHSLSASFTPADGTNYNAGSTSASITVSKASPILTWNNPSPIAYGTALSATQLNASANVAGSFAYSPAAGTVLGTGTHALDATFTPTDTANYNSASASASITVSKADPILTWNNPSTIGYGTALSATQLNASASVAGSFSYDPAAGTVLGAGSHTLSVSFTPSDPASYNPASTSVSITVSKADPVLTWNNPAAIVYGTALSATQLNASANVAGSFVYSPAAGTTLGAGTHTLDTTFTPTDSANYNSGATSASITVSKADPVLTWNNPASIVYGTALSSTQLNASANVAGSFVYSPAAGTVLGAGTHTLGTTFTPTDTANYNSAPGSVSITVSKANPIVTWNNPAAIVYGTALSATQLNASANVAGSFAYSPAAGTVLGAGTHSLGTTFTPTDAANYNTAPGSVSITVTKKALSIQTNNASKVYGQALPAFTVSGTGFVNGDTVASLSGTATFSTSATATSAPGNYAVTPAGLSSANYTITFVAGSLTITKASTSVALSTSPNPSTPNQNVVVTAVVSAVAPGAGTPTGTIEFRDNGVLLGTATLVNGTATLTKKFNKGTHPLTAIYAGNTNFNGSTGASSHVVP